jgi:hypothetical protein
MLVHSNVGSSANNMGNESHFKWLKAACNARKIDSLNHFLGLFLAYLQDYCSVEYVTARLSTKKSSVCFHSQKRS